MRPDYIRSEIERMAPKFNGSAVKYGSCSERASPLLPQKRCWIEC